MSANSKIFSFNSDTHKILEKEKISHEIAENYIDKDDKLQIFDSTVSNYNWYEHISSKNLEFNGVNLLGMLDTAELHQLFIKKLTSFGVIDMNWAKLEIKYLGSFPKIKLFVL